MKRKRNKKVPPVFASKTWQELAVKQLLLQANISFVQQQQIQLSTCYVVVDFLIDHSIVLEVSATRMHRHGVPLKLKALQIEAKFAQLRQEAEYRLWVLFESTRRIPPRLYHALRRRMPSIDRLLTSRAQLQRVLQDYFLNSIQHHTSKRVLPKENRILESFFDEKQLFMKNPKHNGLNKQLCKPIEDLSLYRWSLAPEKWLCDTMTHSRKNDNYSLDMKKEFFRENPETEVD